MRAFEGKRVLVTGGDGFIGKELVRQLIREGAEVTVLSRSKTSASHHLCADITKADELADITGTYDVVYHLAALVSVRKSLQNPEETFKINVEGTKNMLEFAKRCNVKKFIFCSSCMVYGHNDGAVAETSPCGPENPYGKSKLEAEKLVRESGRFFDVAIGRFFNAYGSGQEGDVIGLFIRNALGNKPLRIEGSGNQKRDFLHVRDIAHALILLDDEKADGETLNFATGEGTSINDLAQAVIRMTKSASQIVRTKAAQTEGSSIGNIAKARKLLGWSPKIRLEEGLKEMVAELSRRRDAAPF